MASLPCDYCGHTFLLDLERCPHCARPGLFPNVRLAQLPENVQALDERYQKAVAGAAARGCEERVRELESAAGRSKAVLARPLAEVDRLATSDRELYASFYELQGVRLPADDVWNRLRRAADNILFPGHTDKVRFAALSLGPVGLSNYGDCSVVLRDDLIDYRATAFEANSVLFLKQRNFEEPPGSRAPWEERSKLCVAKLAGEIEPTTPSEKLAELVLQPGATSEEDRFVEVHIWGPFTRRAFERVTVTPSLGKRPKKVLIKALANRLKEIGVPLEDQT